MLRGVSATALIDDAAVDVTSWRERLLSAEVRADAAEARVAELSEQVAVLSDVLGSALRRRASEQAHNRVPDHVRKSFALKCAPIIS